MEITGPDISATTTQSAHPPFPLDGVFDTPPLRAAQNFIRIDLSTGDGFSTAGCAIKALCVGNCIARAQRRKTEELNEVKRYAYTAV